MSKPTKEKRLQSRKSGLIMVVVGIGGGGGGGVESGEEVVDNLNREEGGVDDVKSNALRHSNDILPS